MNENTLGVIELKDIVKGGMRDRFDHLRAMGIRTVGLGTQNGSFPLEGAAVS